MKPTTKTLRLEDVQDPERLTRVLNNAIEPAHAALSNGLTFTENFQAAWHTTPVLYVPDDWTDMTPLGSGWTDLGRTSPTYSAYGPAQYRKTASGEVVARGVLKQTAGTSPAFLFPQGPATTAACIVRGDSAFAAFDVATSGILSLTTGTAATSVHLAGVRFLAADRTPPVPACFPYDFAVDFRPRAVFLTRVTEDSPTRRPRVAVSAPDWEYSSNGYVRINNVPGLIPTRKYVLEFLAVAE